MHTYKLRCKLYTVSCTQLNIGQKAKYYNITFVEIVTTEYKFLSNRIHYYRKPNNSHVSRNIDFGVHCQQLVFCNKMNQQIPLCLTVGYKALQSYMVNRAM